MHVPNSARILPGAGYRRSRPGDYNRKVIRSPEDGFVMKNLAPTDAAALEAVETREWLESLDYVLRPGRQGPRRSGCSRRCARARARPASGCRSRRRRRTSTRSPPPSRCRIRATARSSAASRASSAGTRWRWSCAPTASRTASAATSRPTRRRRRSTRSAFNHFFRGKDAGARRRHRLLPGPRVAGHLRARVSRGPARPRQHLRNFRHELRPGGGLSSYPHPWLMPDFWEFPTVSMGLGPLHGDLPGAVHAQYLENRGLKPPSDQKVWAFLGDGETDEPEALGSISLAAREKLDNLIFVINCNLQRLDGPVRGNGQIIQELEAVFRGAGWNVIKVLWGSDWDDAARARHRRPARQAHGRGRRRRVPALRRRGRRVSAQALLGRRSAAARDGASTCRTTS